MFHMKQSKISQNRQCHETFYQSCLTSTDTHAHIGRYERSHRPMWTFVTVDVRRLCRNNRKTSIWYVHLSITHFTPLVYNHIDVFLICVMIASEKKSIFALMGAFNNVILLNGHKWNNTQKILSLLIVFIKIIRNVSSVSPTRM